VTGTLSRGRKTLLIINRSVLACLICLAFFQPSLKITRLVSSRNTIPVLIDLSASMKLFDTDSPVSLLLAADSLRSAKGEGGAPEFVFFGFGDSCRPVADLRSLRYNDRSTIFPLQFNFKQIPESRTILIVSDGNWSNVIPEKSMLHDKQCYFVPLRQTAHPSYIHLSSQSALTSFIRDSQPTVTVMVQGFNAHREPIRISCRRGRRILAEKKIPADSGFFADEVVLPVRAETAGVSLLEIVASLGDTIRSSCYVIHDVLPDTFSACLWASRPSLDKRFFTLALQRASSWRTLPAGSPDAGRADVFVFFDWDASARDFLALHKKPCAAFIGCLPGEKPQMLDVSTFAPVISPGVTHDLAAAAGSDLPPLTQGFFYAAPPFDIQKVFMSLRAAKESDRPGSSDIPLFFEAVTGERHTLMFAARGIWRWDFWPKSLAPAREHLAFTDYIIKRLEELVLFNTNRDLHVYPLISPVYETDSITFKASLPGFMNNLPAVKTAFSVTDTKGDTVFDSVYTIMPILNRSSTLKTPPLKQGVYQYACTVLSGKKRAHFSDSIRISSDNSELRVQGQNMTALKEIARPLEPLSPHELTDRFRDRNKGSAAMHETVTQTVTINRSWLLLCLIIGFFALEWIIRRAWRLD